MASSLPGNRAAITAW